RLPPTTTAWRRRTFRRPAASKGLLACIRSSFPQSNSPDQGIGKAVFLKGRFQTRAANSCVTWWRPARVAETRGAQGDRDGAVSNPAHDDVLLGFQFFLV